MYGTIHIHNIHQDGVPPNERHHFYIGRGNSWFQLKKSPLANPFTVKQFGRELALERYKRWLATQTEGEVPYLIHLMTGIVRGGQNIHLYCWCAPQECHGDVVKALIEERLGARKEPRHAE